MRMLDNTDKEKKKIVDMWNYCFSDSPEFVEWNFRRNFESSNTFVAERGGEICANLQLMPYKVNFWGEETESVYVSGVATMPQYRNQGCVRELITESLKMLRSRGIPIAHLIPFNFRFYEKFGFKSVSDRCTLRITLDKIPYTCATEFKLYNSMDQISDEVIERLDKIYCGMCSDLKFYVKRNKDNWTKILEDIILNSNGYVAICDESYILYGKNNEDISVYELGYSTADGFRKALSFLKVHSAERKNAEITTRFTPVIKSEMCDIRNMVSINPFAMFRIVDAEYVLGTVARKCDFAFTVKIEDDIIDENNSCFKIQSGMVERCNDDNPDVLVKIKELSSIVCGYISLKDAYEIGTVEIKNKKVLSKLSSVFESCDSYINLML